jgi:histidine triad (HIT) family protein
MDDCLFCRIVRGEIPAEVIHDDEHCLAFRDIAPQAPVHVLVIPKQHVDNLAQIDRLGDSVAGHLLRVAASTARAEGVSDSGFRTVINCNQHGGQSVGHLHVHVLGGRQLSWPPG